MASAKKHLVPLVGLLWLTTAQAESIRDCAECPEMAVLPAGNFQMGMAGRPATEPVRTVALPAFAIGKTEVTQGQWKAIMGTNPSKFQACGNDCPVEQVTWSDAQEFGRRLSAKTGKTYRLPSGADGSMPAGQGNRAGTVAAMIPTSWHGTGTSMATPTHRDRRKPNARGSARHERQCLEGAT